MKHCHICGEAITKEAVKLYPVSKHVAYEVCNACYWDLKEAGIKSNEDGKRDA